MRLVVFTANRPRHAALIRALLDAKHQVLVTVVEPKVRNTQEPTLARYWRQVDGAERAVFRDHPMPGRLLEAKGRLSDLQVPELAEADGVVVFGAPYIRPPLLPLLIHRHALNLHMGIAPEYRGSACNFWAEYDGRPELVGAQVQRLSDKLDQGDILWEVRTSHHGDPFVRGMFAVRNGIEAMVKAVTVGPAMLRPCRPNDPSQQIRYSRYADFTPEVAAEYLARLGR